jgi:hypothetical protein
VRGLTCVFAGCRKKKHRKRRIVQPALARALAERLAPGGQLFLQVSQPARQPALILCVAAPARTQLHLHACGLTPQLPALLALFVCAVRSQSDVKSVCEDMVSVFESVAGDLLELAPVHYGPGASPDWPPPEASHINQGDNAQRDAMRAASRRKARKLAARGAGGDAAGAATDAAAAGSADAAAAAAADAAAPAADAAAACADGDADGEGDDGSDSGDSDFDDGPTGWAARPGNGWLRDNPVGVPTERELGTNAAGGHCWRALLQRRDVAVAPPAAAAEGGAAA